MRLFISKFIRIIKKGHIPNTCYAYQWIPQSLSHTCDCSVFCKFPPKGNTHIPVIAYNTNPNNTNLKEVDYTFCLPFFCFLFPPRFAASSASHSAASTASSNGSCKSGYMTSSNNASISSSCDSVPAV